MTRGAEPGGLKRAVRRLGAQLGRYLVAGMLVWIPLIITIWVTWLLIGKIGLGAEHLIAGLFGFLQNLGAKTERLEFLRHIEYRRGLGLVLTVALFLGTGVLTRYIVGRRLIAAGERLLNRIPFIRPVYRSVKQIRDVVIGRKGAVFQRVCLIEYPRAGMLAVAFVTSFDQGPVQERAGKKLIAVFIPTTPNPTSGYLVYLPPEDITILDMTVEDAMKLIVSAGAYVPGLHGELKPPPTPKGETAEELLRQALENAARPPKRPGGEDDILEDILGPDRPEPTERV